MLIPMTPRRSVTSFGQSDENDGVPEVSPIHDPFKTPAPSSAGGSSAPPSPIATASHHHHQHTSSTGAAVPSLAVSDSSGRLAVPYSPVSPSSSDPSPSEGSVGGGGGPPSPSLSATSSQQSETSRSPFVGRSTTQHPLSPPNDGSPRRFNPGAAGRHTRNSPSVATMGSVFTEEGDVTAPIAVDFDNDDGKDSEHPGMTRKHSSGSSTGGGWKGVGVGAGAGGGRDRQGSVGAGSSLGVPETVGEDPDSEVEDASQSGLHQKRDEPTGVKDGQLPKPATSKKGQKRPLWRRIPFLGGKKGSGEEEEEEGGDDGEGKDGEEGDEDPMIAARLAARQAAALPDPSASELAPFVFSPRKLNSLVDPKSIDTLREIGGVKGLLEGLRVDPKKGLAGEGGEGGGEGRGETGEWEKRGNVYGENRIPARPSKGLLRLMWIAIQDKVLGTSQASVFPPSQRCAC